MKPGVECPWCHSPVADLRLPCPKCGKLTRVAFSREGDAIRRVQVQELIGKVAQGGAGNLISRLGGPRHRGTVPVPLVSGLGDARGTYEEDGGEEFHRRLVQGLVGDHRAGAGGG